MGFCRVLGGDGGAAIGILARKRRVGRRSRDYAEPSEEHGLRTSCSFLPFSFSVRQNGTRTGTLSQGVTLASCMATAFAGPQSASSSVRRAPSIPRCD